MRLNFLSVPLFHLLSGEIVLAASDGREVGIGAGEAAYAGRSLAPMRLATTPPPLDRDISLSNRAFNFNICRP